MSRVATYLNHFKVSFPTSRQSNLALPMHNRSPQALFGDEHDRAQKVALFINGSAKRPRTGRLPADVEWVAYNVLRIPRAFLADSVARNSRPWPWSSLGRETISDSVPTESVPSCESKNPMTPQNITDSKNRNQSRRVERRASFARPCRRRPARPSAVSDSGCKSH